MRTNADYYEETADLLADRWQQDAEMMETNPARWQMARTLDDWLVAHREDAKISPALYRTKCISLRRIYETTRTQTEQKGAA